MKPKRKEGIFKVWFLLLSFAYRLCISLIATAASTINEISAIKNPSGVIAGTDLGVGVGVGVSGGVIVDEGVGVGTGFISISQFSVSPYSNLSHPSPVSVIVPFHGRF